MVRFHTAKFAISSQHEYFLPFLPLSLIPSLPFFLSPLLEVRIGFEVATVTVNESAVVDIAVSLQGGMLGRTAAVEVTSVDGLATGQIYGYINVTPFSRP